MNRRTVLVSAIVTIGSGGCLSNGTGSRSCEVACFGFDHRGYDDAPDWLTVRHTGGRDLSANEVFITGIAEEWSSPGEGETKPWFELDDELGPTAGIAGEDVQVDLGYVSTVRVLWRHDGNERVIGEWTYEPTDVDL